MEMAKELVRKTEGSKAVAKGGASLANSGAGRALDRHAAKKHAAKKTAAKKHAKKSVERDAEELRIALHDARHGDRHGKKHDDKKKEDKGNGGKHERKALEKAFAKSANKSISKAFHHLERASAVISLIEPESGGDLKLLLHAGIELYREVTSVKKHQRDERRVACALGLLAASEHLSMAGLYAARGVHQLAIEPPSTKELEDRLKELTERLDEAGARRRKGYPARLVEMARELLVRAEGADHDPHLAYELTMAVDGLVKALDSGLE